MTALDAMLPGLRQRPEPTPRTNGEAADAGGRAGPADFVSVLGGLEDASVHEAAGRVAEDSVPGDDAPRDASPAGSAAPDPAQTGIPAAPAALPDPQAALRALMGLPAATTPAPAQNPDLAALAARAAASGRAQAEPTRAAAPDSGAGSMPGAISAPVPTTMSAPAPTTLPATMPAGRTRIDVLAQETHFAPVGATPADAARTGAPIPAAPVSEARRQAAPAVLLTPPAPMAAPESIAAPAAPAATAPSGTPLPAAAGMPGPAPAEGGTVAATPAVPADRPAQVLPAQALPAQVPPTQARSDRPAEPASPPRGIAEPATTLRRAAPAPAARPADAVPAPQIPPVPPAAAPATVAAAEPAALSAVMAGALPSTLPAAAPTPVRGSAPAAARQAGPGAAEPDGAASTAAESGAESGPQAEFSIPAAESAPARMRERPAGGPVIQAPGARTGEDPAPHDTETQPAGGAAAAPASPDIAPAGQAPAQGLPAATLRQIAASVAAEAPVAAPAQAAAHDPAGGPLRLLTLQLHPADLGAVVVRMRLQDGRLEMSLQTSREETADLLRKDREALGELLRGAGYRPDIVTIQSGPADQQGPGSRGQAAFQAETGAGGTGPGTGSSPERGPGDQPGRRGAATPDEPARSRDQGHETASGEPRGGVYL